MSKIERRCPPYEGGDPYLYLCFAEKDSEAVFPLLEHLYRRGIRIWYNVESTADMEELNRQQERMNGASLVVLYLTDNVREAGNKKNTLLYYQQQGKPVISIDTDSGDNELSVGLTETAKHIDARAIRGAEELEAELIRTEGFSQELIGDPPKVKNRIGRAAAVILAIVLLMAGVSYYGYRQHGWFVTWLPIPTPPPAAAPGAIDTVSFGDARLTDALRDAVDGGMITTETLEQVTKLKLAELPEDLSELKEKVPNLTTLILPQEAAKDALEAADGQYTIVLAPEGEAAQ